jgi:hypothetical protein
MLQNDPCLHFGLTGRYGDILGQNRNDFIEKSPNIGKKKCITILFSTVS